MKKPTVQGTGARSRVKTRLAGLGPRGGGWNIDQASDWSGIGSRNLRAMAKRKLENDEPSLFPCHLIGRRILIPRRPFQDWFNRRTPRVP